MIWRDRGGRSLDSFVELTLAPFTVREIQRPARGDPYKHQYSCEQDDNNQGSLLVSPKREQLYRQVLRALLISGLRLG